MDFAELANRTGLPIRKLRYVVDYDVLPDYYLGLEDKTSTSHGVPRQFSPFLGFCIALLAAFREANLSREQAQKALEFLIEWATPMVARSTPPDKPMKLLPLILMFASGHSITVEIGDCHLLRIRARRTTGRSAKRLPESSEWIEIEAKAKMPQPSAPFIVTRFSLSELAKRLH